MRTIHKYVLREVANAVDTHEGVQWLHAAGQNDDMVVWAEVDTTKPASQRTLHVVGTGQLVPDEAEHYIGSCLLHAGVFVFHIYEGRRPRG